MESSDNLIVWFTGAVAFSTVVYAVLTAVLVHETRSLRKAQFDPKLTVRIEYDASDRNGLFELVIRNHGGGAAQNISLGFEGDPDNFVTSNPIGEMAVFSDGINYLEPHGIFRIPLGWFNDKEKFESALQNPWAFNVQYEDTSGKGKKDTFTIDFRQFSGLWYTSGSMSRIAKSVESMKRQIDQLGHVAWGGKLHVITQTKEEFAAELEQLKREQRQQG